MSNDKNKLFIGNLSWKASEEELRTVFEQYGTVVEVKVVVDNYTGRSRGFAFVIMGSQEEAEAAIENLDKTQLMGRELRVSLAEDRRNAREPRESNGNGNGYARRENNGYRSERSEYPRERGYAGARQR